MSLTYISLVICSSILINFVLFRLKSSHIYEDIHKYSIRVSGMGIPILTTFHSTYFHSHAGIG